MNKRHIPGFFDALARTPSFVFLCSMFLCGAAAGGLTGLHAAEGDCALVLTALLRELPGQAGKSVLCAVLWLVLPPAAALFRPAALWLSGHRSRAGALCSRCRSRSRSRRGGGGRPCGGGASGGHQRVGAARRLHARVGMHAECRTVGEKPRAVCAVSRFSGAECAAARVSCDFTGRITRIWLHFLLRYANI